MAQFWHAFSSVRYKLFQSYATSFYGSQLCDYSSFEVNKLFIAWRKSVRFIWKLPYRTHNVLLPEICRSNPFEIQLHSRFLKFIHKISQSDTLLLRTCFKLVMNGSRSQVGRSFNYILQKYDIERSRFTHEYIDDIYCTLKEKSCPPSPELKAQSGLIRELCEIRDGSMDSHLHHTEVVELIEYLCTL